MDAAVVLLLCISVAGVMGQRKSLSQCDQSSCYPATGDLLVGREMRLKTSSTCGMTRPERYCIVSHLEDQQNKCFVCDSRDAYGFSNKMSHRIENIVSGFRRDWKLRWWQAQNGVQNVMVQLDLEAEFHFTHLIMRFKTFRPAAMLIERSYDFGKSWKVYRYFAYDCADAFPHVPTQPIRSIQDVICESRYSDVAPSTEGEVIFRVLPASVEIENPYSEEVQDLLKMTNLRVNFTKLHTLGDNLLDSRAEIKEKYYYSMYNMVVRGSCSCYGHASRCVPAEGEQDIPNMVHGKCECTHNTKGLNCEQCDDFYNDLPWRPARVKETNACAMCECNNHASKCHFDPAVYEATVRVSGGVCDDCQHNTMGHHCEECKPFFYHDPAYDIRDPYVCRACDCDPIGSEHGGECEGRTDPYLDLEAGRCSCKRFVEGRRCDTCRDGFWNLIVDNPDGCEPCTCHTVGTVGNFGCDKVSGECRCKRYVGGRQCDECLPGYYGLSDEPQGCEACDCDPGGAVDNNCHQQTGQCTCRANIRGRRCDDITPGYFVTDLDWHRYEAESARGIGKTRVVIREHTAGRAVTWTGPGFMRVSEGDSLEFTIDDIPFSMEYDVVVRYETQMPQRWDDVRLTIVRPGAVDQRGGCANSIPQDDLKALSLPHTGKSLPGHYLVSPSSCLEKGVTYKLRLDFNRYRSDRTTAEAGILIDSIVLTPSPASHPMFQAPGFPQSIRDEYERSRCRDNHLSSVHIPMPDNCQSIIFSKSAYVYDGAMDCDCDITGSYSSMCEQFGGQCQCKPFVIGRRCDQCAPGTFGFGPAGCTECTCSEVGSRDKFCDAQTGQCLCVPNAFGRRCDQCQRGYYGYPQCRACQCSGRSDECDFNGVCLTCRDNTGGNHCDRCADGYYGDPRPGSPYGCRQCMCPGGVSSGFQHADSCRLDARTSHVICDCHPGYAGVSCDRCADNYFGNPLVPGGTCERCTCNGNINYAVSGSCDPATGECLKCQHYTEGVNCERCKPGYHGDATRQSCLECVCNILGTPRNAMPCNPVTGQCQCLPHVTGLSCDQCEYNYWKIASGTGCEACACDPEGAPSMQCNEFDGQCHCRPGRGGRDCSECEDYYWGDPKRRCLPCNCNVEGSATMQCNRRTGVCECAVGVTGDKCDRCDRGTTGQLPHCVPCGECFDNWDIIISQLKNETLILIRNASEIKSGGAHGAFDKELKEMELKLEQVKNILAGTNVSVADLDELRSKISQLRQNLTSSSSELDILDRSVTNMSSHVELINNRIEAIKRRAEDLKRTADELRRNATVIRELDVSGAFNSTKESYRRSQEAQRRVDTALDTVRDSESVRDQVDELLRQRQADFERQYETNNRSLHELDIKVHTLDRRIVDLNEMVCDGRGDPCDTVCGGAGCNKCGGVSCSDGAVTKANVSLDLAKRTEVTLRDAHTKAETELAKVNSAKDACDMARSDAQMAFDRAEFAKNESESTRADLQRLIEMITDFLKQDGADPKEIRAVAEEVLAMRISLTPKQINDLARQINQTIRGLTDIDAILAATRDNLRRVQQLQRRADDAKKSADSVLSMAQHVIDMLAKARIAQGAAQTAIDVASQEINDAEDDLTVIESETDEANQLSSKTLITVRDLRERISRLKRKYTENELLVEQAEREANIAESLASKADQDAIELDSKYSDVSRRLELKFNETRSARQRADELKERASRMYQSTYSKVTHLREWETDLSVRERDLHSIATQISILNGQMVELVVSVRNASHYLRTCGTA